MVRKRTAEHEGGGVHAPAWMISWADMTTLLWACFVMLWSFSTLDLVKFQEAASSLQGAFGVLDGGVMVLNLGDIPPIHTPNILNMADKNEMERIQETIQKSAETSGYADSIETMIDSRGLMIRFADTALFDPGSTEIKPAVIPVLETIALELSQISNTIQVEGHTDSTPIHTAQFPSNWELSTGRAAEIVHYMIEIGGIVPERMSAAGYAFYHPVALNSTSQGRAKNRRVDIIVLNSPEQDDTQEPEDALSNDESNGTVISTSDTEDISATEESIEDTPESTVGSGENLNGDYSGI